jgi:hypothetical protein
MKQFLIYWVWPNPGGWHYDDRKITVALVLCGALIVLSFIIRFWRSRLKNTVTRNLSSSWSRATFWFGVVAIILIVSRVEEIQFMAMRLTWALWFGALFLYLLFQFFQFRRRHYTLLERVQVVDERDKYLPHNKV